MGWVFEGGHFVRLCYFAHNNGHQNKYHFPPYFASIMIFPFVNLKNLHHFLCNFLYIFPQLCPLGYL